MNILKIYPVSDSSFSQIRFLKNMHLNFPQRFPWPSKLVSLHHQEMMINLLIIFNSKHCLQELIRVSLEQAQSIRKRLHMLDLQEEWGILSAIWFIVLVNIKSHKVESIGVLWVLESTDYQMLFTLIEVLNKTLNLFLHHISISQVQNLLLHSISFIQNW